MCFALRNVFGTTMLTMLGPGKALRGPDGSMHAAVDGMLDCFQEIALLQPQLVKKGGEVEAMMKQIAIDQKEASEIKAALGSEISRIKWKFHAQYFYIFPQSCDVDFLYKDSIWARFWMCFLA